MGIETHVHDSFEYPQQVVTRYMGIETIIIKLPFKLNLRVVTRYMGIETFSIITLS